MMTLTLPPHTETLLRAVAARRGLSPENALDAILLETESDYHAAIADVQASYDDIAAGRSLSPEEYRAQAMARRQLRSQPLQDHEK